MPLLTNIYAYTNATTINNNFSIFIIDKRGKKRIIK